MWYHHYGQASVQPLAKHGYQVATVASDCLQHDTLGGCTRRAAICATTGALIDEKYIELHCQSKRWWQPRAFTSGSVCSSRNSRSRVLFLHYSTNSQNWNATGAKSMPRRHGFLSLTTELNSRKTSGRNSRVWSALPFASSQTCKFDELKAA